MPSATLLAACALSVAATATALPAPPNGTAFAHHNMSATMDNVHGAIRRHREGEKVRMLHGSGFIPAVTMEWWKVVQERGTILIIAAAGGAGAPGSAASYINNFASMGIAMEFLEIYGTNCPDLVNDPVMLQRVRDAHSVYFSGGMPGMLQGCLYGQDGTLEDGMDVPVGQSTPLLDLILEKQTVGGDSAGLMAQPSGYYFTGTFPHDGATLIGQAQCPSGNMGLRTVDDYFVAHSHFSERGQQGPQLVMQWQHCLEVGAGFDEGLAGYYFEESGDVLIVADPEDSTLRGAWIHEMLAGSEDGQEADVHMIISGEVWNARTNTRVRNPGYADCTGSATTVPDASTSVFSFSQNPIRRLSLEMAALPVGSSIYNTDTGPAGHQVFLELTVTERTRAFCDRFTGEVLGFEFLNFKQGRLNKGAKGLPKPQEVIYTSW